MTNKKGTKRSLLMSALAMLLCVSLLIGSTFAWFTDSVTSAGNIIKSGTLDVEMYWADGTEAVPAADSADWKNAADGAIFNYDQWEPGYTEVRHIKIANVGTLALKYQLNILPNGEVSKLADAIDVYYLDPAAQLSDRASIDAQYRLGTLTEVLAGMSTTASGELLPKEGDTITIALKMQESATNEYQGLSIGTDFSVQLLATQLTAEEDSFDDQYDKMATIDTEAELLEALAGDYDLIELGANIELTGSVVIPSNKTVVIDLMGYTISQTTECTGSYSMIANSGNLTINDSVGSGKISFKDTGVGGSSTWATYTIRNDGTLTVNNGTIEHLGNQEGNAINAIFSYSGDTTINGGSILCPYSRSVRQWKGTLTINGGTFDGQVWVQPTTDCTTTITGGSFKPATNGNDASSVFVTNNVHTVAVSISGGNFATKLGMSSPVKCVTGGTFGVDPSAYVVDGLKAVLVGDVYEIVTDDTKYATASTAAELQAALDNASEVNLIVLTDDIEGDVTAKQIADLDITINGDGHKYAGVILIDGNSATELTSSITLKNINFVADSISADACVQLGDGTTATRYTCNVTVENCTFDVPGAAGIKSYTGGDKNLKVIGCTATANAHSLVQVAGVDSVLIEKCKIYSKNGINTNQSVNITIDGCTADVQGYAVRFGASSGTTGIAETYLIKNSTLKSACAESGDAVIILRGTAESATLTIENTTLEGTAQIVNSANATVIQ